MGGSSRRMRRNWRDPEDTGLAALDSFQVAEGGPSFSWKALVLRAKLP